MTLEKTFEKVDQLLHSLQLEDRKQAYELLEEHFEYNKDNWEYLWRLAMTTHMFVELWIRHTSFNQNYSTVKALQLKANEFAMQALHLNPENADVQKWAGQTLGGTARFVSTSEKIAIGFKYKKYIDKALSLRPNDARLRHLHGRFCFETAGLTWIEQKLATLFYSEPPCSTYHQAKQHFEEAERLQPNKSVDNLLQLARTHECLGDKDIAKKYLHKARKIPPTTPEDRIAVEEVNTMCRKLKLSPK